MVREDNTWYVAISRMNNEFYSFICAGSKYYENFKTLAEKHGVHIVAEQFDVDDATMNGISGFDKDGKRIEGDSLLIDLTKRLSNGEKLDVQEELSNLCLTS